MIFKTENLITYFEVLSAIQQAKVALDRAWLAKSDGDPAWLRKQLGQCQAALDRADQLAREAAQQMIAYADVPTEKYLLFRYNQNVIRSIERCRKYLADVIEYHTEQGRQVE